MNRIAITIGLLVLAGCGSGGGGEDALAPQPAARSLNQPGTVADILVATDQGLQRGSTNGQGQRLIFAQPDLYFSAAAISHGHVFYLREGDIWAVRTDGTGNRAVVNTPETEFVATTNGPWLIYGQYIAQPSGRLLTRYGSANIDTGARFQFDDTDGTYFIRQNDTRLISTHTEEQVSSITNSGTDRLTYDSRTSGGPLLATQQIVGSTLIYSRSTDTYSRTFMIPLSGGGATQLDEDQYNTFSAWSIGDRVIYHRSEASASQPQSDVVSIRTNGQGRVVLTTDPANEAVQGTVGNHVIIRRNSTDELIAVPVTGGAERSLMTMGNEDFVQLTSDDVIVVSRPSGVWTVDLNGTLKQIGTVLLRFDFTFAGNAVCGNNGNAVPFTPPHPQPDRNGQRWQPGFHRGE